MWWPRGYGQQRLYNLTVEILDGQLQVLSTKIIKIGFRTVELVEDPLPGNSNGNLNCFLVFVVLQVGPGRSDPENICQSINMVCLEKIGNDKEKQV
ncbi:hypothetical protein DPMN_151875 [Dreissena polymorpha]|uniref:Uncharacterized protein n=1 Tax=Dreissena polymorpha TaxID=45954 RepID=A0A9D4FG69_DREPO|nr:hypothetical protein DPMN_151875 [Dreissena polymorpha]